MEALDCAVGAAVRFENLTVRYEGSSKLALQGVSLDIAAGSKVSSLHCEMRCGKLARIICPDVHCCTGGHRRTHWVWQEYISCCTVASYAVFQRPSVHWWDRYFISFTSSTQTSAGDHSPGSCAVSRYCAVQPGSRGRRRRGHTSASSAACGLVSHCKCRPSANTTGCHVHQARSSGKLTLDSEVGSSGGALSLGQKQLIVRDD